MKSTSESLSHPETSLWVAPSGNDDTGDITGAPNYITMTVIPEPNVAALLGGLGTLFLLRRRR
jgi:hypothetical protein